MALMPKRVKHRKKQRGRIKGNASRGNTVAFGDLHTMMAVQDVAVFVNLDWNKHTTFLDVRFEGCVFLGLRPRSFSGRHTLIWAADVRLRRLHAVLHTCAGAIAQFAYSCHLTAGASQAAGLLSPRGGFTGQDLPGI